MGRTPMRDSDFGTPPQGSNPSTPELLGAGAADDGTPSGARAPPRHFEHHAVRDDLEPFGDASETATLVNNGAVDAQGYFDKSAYEFRHLFVQDFFDFREGLRAGYFDKSA
eukprot:6055289-Alexandrium_andersonii.AAC.1